MIIDYAKTSRRSSVHRGNSYVRITGAFWMTPEQPPVAMSPCYRSSGQVKDQEVGEDGGGIDAYREASCPHDPQAGPAMDDLEAK